jgi:hypothetical protein
MKKFLTFIDIVEKQLGYQIQISPLSKEEFDMMPCGVQLRDKKWTFLYFPGESYTSSLLCHELMHIVLEIEGWPTFSLHIDTQKFSDTKYISGVLSNLFPHAEIWKRGIQLGFSESNTWNEDIDKNIVPKVNKKLLAAKSARPELQIQYQATCLAYALLSPASRPVKRRLKKCACLNLPQAFEQANAICRLHSEYEKSFPQSLEIALKRVLEIVKMPAETLLLEFPSTASPELFSHMQQSCRQDQKSECVNMQR